MGASSSIQEKVLQASFDGDIQKLKKYAPDDEDGRTIINLARDKEERSCLIIAAIRGQVRVAKWLLERGVDVSYQAPSCGSALHVAAARKHDEMVEMLLKYGADPFVANLKGSTAIELAVLAGSETIVSMFHSRSLFSGEVEMQWKRMLGYEWKSRYVVVMERRACPLLYSSTSRDLSSSTTARRQMWIHSNRSSLVPKTRCWLEGSSSYLAGSTKSSSIVRLHIAHAIPTGNGFTRFAEGYCFFTRPSAGKKSSGNAIARWAHFNECMGLEGGSDTVLSALGVSPLPLPASIQLIPSITPFLLENGGRAAASGSAMPLGALPTPAVNATVRRSVAAPSPNPLRMSINALPSGDELTAAAFGGLTLDPNQSMPSLSAPSVSLPSTAFSSSQSTPIRGSSYAGIVDGFCARPGETDAQFASRLSEAVGVAALADSIGSRSDHNRPLGNVSSQKAASLPATPLRGSLAGVAPVVVNSISSGGMTMMVAGCSSSHQSSSGGGGLSSKDMGRSSSSGMIVNQGGSSSRNLPPRAPPKLPSFASSVSASKLRASLPGEVDEAPSAPPLEELVALTGAGGEERDSGPFQDMCILCLSAPSQAGFLHGNDVHRCVCRSCSKIEQWVGMPCPVCRATIEKVLGVF